MRKAINHLKKTDPVMATIITKVGPYKPAKLDPSFKTLVRAIVFQQLATGAARTIHGRLEALCDGRVTPQAIMNLSVGEMRRAGLSRQKLSYIRDLADHVHEGRLEFTQLHKLPDEEVIEILTDVKGIGRWTAQMFLLFALERPNVLPTGDLGVQNAIKKAYHKRKVTPKHIEKMGKKWEPYCSVASWYLWRSLDQGAEI